MYSRKWKNWPSRFAQAVEATSGMAGLISGGIAVTGVVLSAPIATGLGAFGFIGTLCYLGVRSFPKKMPQPAKMVGQELSLEELASVEPAPVRLAVVGASQAGKSTFLQTTLHADKAIARTNRVSAEMLMLSGDPPLYVALLDADGTEFVQQFEIAKEADFLIIFVDHSVSSTDLGMSESRLSDHRNFIAQIEAVLKRRESIPKLHFLFNKRDLWESGTDVNALTEWFETTVSEWRRLNLAQDFSYSLHSNREQSDIAKLIKEIRTFVSHRSAK